jgi:rare lipoprotein A
MSCAAALTGTSRMAKVVLAACVMAAAVVAPGTSGADDRQDRAAPQRVPVSDKPPPDLSGKRRLGIASFYADNFGGKTMANGAPMNLDGNNAASRSLPLGTQAKVTNLETGKSATVVIADRGPYVQGRIVDLSPATARKIGITRRKGISPVVVAPITVPQPDGSTKHGVAAQESQPLREASLAPGKVAKASATR